MPKAKPTAPIFTIMVGEERVEYTWSKWPDGKTNIHARAVGRPEHPSYATKISPMTEEIAKELMYLKLRSYKQGREDGIELVQKRFRKLIGL